MSESPSRARSPRSLPRAPPPWPCRATERPTLTRVPGVRKAVLDRAGFTGAAGDLAWCWTTASRRWSWSASGRPPRSAPTSSAGPPPPFARAVRRHRRGGLRRTRTLDLDAGRRRPGRGRGADPRRLPLRRATSPSPVTPPGSAASPWRWATVPPTCARPAGRGRRHRASPRPCASPATWSTRPAARSRPPVFADRAAERRRGRAASPSRCSTRRRSRRQRPRRPARRQPGLAPAAPLRRSSPTSPPTPRRGGDRRPGRQGHHLRLRRPVAQDRPTA